MGWRAWCLRRTKLGWLAAAHSSLVVESSHELRGALSGSTGRAAEAAARPVLPSASSLRCERAGTLHRRSCTSLGRDRVENGNRRRVKRPGSRCREKEEARARRPAPELCGAAKDAPDPELILHLAPERLPGPCLLSQVLPTMRVCSLPAKPSFCSSCLGSTLRI